ncbi:uncharacterized protein LOC101847738 [Aplysia californica]|uniref:Uncharacterized protein LOC101847738 n=1 Tax=Aplysia californica TaxID=6500 RepID=A0ABM0JUG2_APLCA|nr:uncharacterized protein LOC101847738 [Aplysia californica]
MGTAFLQNEVGKILGECLAEVCETRPGDPIEFIAHWLYRHKDSVMYFQQKSDVMRELAEMAARVEEERRMRRERCDQLRKQVHDAARKLRSECLPSSMLFGPDLFQQYGSRLAPHLQQQFFNRKGKAIPAAMRRYMYMDGGPAGMMGYKDGAVPMKYMNSRAGMKQKYYGHARAPYADGTMSDSDMPYCLTGDNPSSYSPGMFGRLSRREKRLLKAAQLQREYMAEWEVTEESCQLVCQHPLLGPLTRRICNADEMSENPDVWHSKDFKCPTFYDHEIYTRCNTDSDSLLWIL